MTDEHVARFRDADGMEDGQDEPMRPMSAKVRWDHHGNQYAYGITDENAPRILRSIMHDEPDPERRAMQREPDDLYDLSGGYEDQSVPIGKWMAIGIVAACVAGTCVWLVVIAYLAWG